MIARILGLIALCGLLFGGGLAGSLYLRAVQRDPAVAQQGDDLPELEQPAAAAELPVAMHSQPMSADEVFRFAASIRGREQQIQARLEAVEQQESRLRMMQEDLRGQRRELDGLLGQVQDTLQRSVEALQQVEEQRRLLQQDRSTASRDLQRAEQLRQADQQRESENLKKLAQWMQELTPEFAGQYVRDEIEAGNLKRTVEVLAKIEPREVAKILSNMGDTQLMGKVTDEVLKLRPPPKQRQR